MTGLRLSAHASIARGGYRRTARTGDTGDGLADLVQLRQGEVDEAPGIEGWLQLGDPIRHHREQWQTHQPGRGGGLDPTLFYTGF